MRGRLNLWNGGLAGTRTLDQCLKRALTTSRNPLFIANFHFYLDICLYICHYAGMKPRGLYSISPFENPNKTTAYRVTGTKLDGVRIRENYKTQPEALARKQQLEIEALNFAPEKRITTTRLTPASAKAARRAVSLEAT